MTIFVSPRKYGSGGDQPNARGRLIAN